MIKNSSKKIVIKSKKSHVFIRIKKVSNLLKSLQIEKIICFDINLKRELNHVKYDKKYIPSKFIRKFADNMCNISGGFHHLHFIRKIFSNKFEHLILSETHYRE